MAQSRCPRHNIFYEKGKKCPKCREIYNRNRHKKHDFLRFYNSKQWKDLRQYVIQYYMNIDIYVLGLNGKITFCKKSTVHHIVELASNINLGLDFNNLVLVDEYSHSQIHKLYDSGRKEEAIETINKGKELFEKLKNGNEN